ncbi:MAG TPA: pyrroloquinoline quinone biosynthesis protein PqqB [Steroidobacteraceae bacterium]|nr:pyrroloquinoline quinone biosynthesis protein PqqB [Steroidobacteraceae bacterium]
MKIRVLGSAAGGGFPQWNCNCRNCAGVRSGGLRALRRTQSSIAVRGDAADSWVLVNASPDILGQLATYPDLQPARARRDSAIAAIVLVDGQVDHTTGLFMLRESTRPLSIWCTDAACADLTRGNPIFAVLQHYCGVDRHSMTPDGCEFTVDGAEGILWQAMAVPGKPAPYSPHREAPVRGDNVALVVRDAASQRSVVYAPGLGAMEPTIWLAMQEASCVLVDGTFWTDEEMVALGLSSKRAREIGHLPQCGSGGMLEWLERLAPATRRILIHVNNSNPILDEDSAERAELTRRGIEVAWDGLELEI